MKWSQWLRTRWLLRSVGWVISSSGQPAVPFFRRLDLSGSHGCWNKVLIIGIISAGSFWVVRGAVEIGYQLLVLFQPICLKLVWKVAEKMYQLLVLFQPVGFTGFENCPNKVPVIDNISVNLPWVVRKVAEIWYQLLALSLTALSETGRLWEELDDEWVCVSHQENTVCYIRVYIAAAI